MRRLLCCLLGSTLIHGLLLWVPFPMRAGGEDENALRPLRIRLVAAPRAEPDRRVSRKSRQAPKHRGARTAVPARARKSPPARKRPETPARHRMAAVPAPPEPAATAPVRVRPLVKEPGKRQPAGSDGNVAERTHRARAMAADKSEDRGVEASTRFNPVRYARTVTPRYPGKARRAGWQGTTVLKVRVDSEGAPDRVTVDRTSGFDILDAAAVKAMGRWRFHPARRGNHRVAAWVRIPVTFKLKEDKR